MSDSDSLTSSNKFDQSNMLDGLYNEADGSREISNSHGVGGGNDDWCGVCVSLNKSGRLFEKLSKLSNLSRRGIACITGKFEEL